MLMLFAGLDGQWTLTTLTSGGGNARALRRVAKRRDALATATTFRSPQMKSAGNDAVSYEQCSQDPLSDAESTI
jgi:hypothetical protein